MVFCQGNAVTCCWQSQKMPNHPCQKALLLGRALPTEFIACELHSTFMHASDTGSRRARRAWYSIGPEKRVAAEVWARSGQVMIISVPNGEHSFCSKIRYDEEKSFRGRSFLPAKRRASSAEPPFFWSLGIHLERVTGKESVKGTLLRRLIDIVVVRRQEDVGLLRTDRPPLTLSGSSDLRNLSQG